VAGAYQMTGPRVERRASWRRALRPDRWTLESLTVASIAGGSLVFAHFLKALSDLQPDRVDFAIFYQAVGRWRAAGLLYDPTGALINYNPPQFHLLLLPFAYLPLHAAFVLWTAFSVAAAAATLVVARNESAGPWSRREDRLFLAAVLLCAGSGASVHLGQVGWLVALPMTLAWRASRRNRWAAAGLWLGCAVATKPFLLLFAPALVIRRRWSALFFASLAFAMSFAAGAAVFGTDSLIRWFHLLRGGAPVQQMSLFINASMLAVLVRGGAPKMLAATAAAILLAITLWRVRSADEDTTWLVVISCSIVASPLGWIYYLPLVAGPLTAVSKDGRIPASLWAIWPLLAFPAISRDLFQSHAALAVGPGSIYGWGTFLLWRGSLRGGLGILPRTKELSR
jgi:hypothetical protein